MRGPVALAALVACLAAAGCGHGPPEGVVELHRMELWLGTSQEPPETYPSEWRRVSMPDVWDVGRRARFLEGWYRAGVDVGAPDAADPPAVYLPAFSGHVTLYWNGERVGDSGPYREDDTRHARGPLLVTLPGAAASPGEGRLEIRFRATEAVTDFLRAPLLGPRSALHPLHQRKLVLARFVPIVFSAAGILVALVLLVVHWRDEEFFSYLPWLTGGLLANALASAGLFASFGPLPPRVAEPLRPALFHLAMPCYAIALHRVRGLDRRRLERWLLGVWAAFALLAFSVPLILTFAVAVVWAVPTILCAVYVVWMLIRVAPQVDPRRAVVFYAPLLVGGAFVGYDVWSALRDEPPGQLLSIYATAMVTISIFAMHLSSSREALVSARALNRELDARVEAKGRELARGYERLRAAEREQAVRAERERMLRDMHDGLGSQLVSTLAMVESGSFDADDLAEALRDTLDDLRLTVHSIDPAEADLLAMLAVVRERIEPRLARRGLRFEWHVTDLPEIPGLDPAGLMHVLRIVQEVLTNVVKHARATTITVETRVSPPDAEPPHVALSIRDDGVGLPEAPGGGRGLANMRERARAVGGTLEIRSEEEPRGTCVTLRLPLQLG